MSISVEVYEALTKENADLREQLELTEQRRHNEIVHYGKLWDEAEAIRKQRDALVEACEEIKKRPHLSGAMTCIGFVPRDAWCSICIAKKALAAVKEE